MEAHELIQQLQLIPHPEGGYYRETYRCDQKIDRGNGSLRNVSTAIYFLLSGHDKSNFHRIQSDELWFFHHGEPLEIVYIQNGKINTVLLGTNLQAGELLQAKIDANTWFASRIKSGNAYSLVSCTVAPGFDFADFELASRMELSNEYPELKEVIAAFTNP
jgi:uncharacterized protein